MEYVDPQKPVFLPASYFRELNWSVLMSDRWIVFRDGDEHIEYARDPRETTEVMYW
ncbi:MAG: hypothetical protein HY617_01300 [Candidatus Sungbacteria bacterium]|nr:hypothetical protein [Candidatus Sungbacteria bacterium]